MKRTLLIAALIVGGLGVGGAVVSAQETKTNAPSVGAVPAQRNGLEMLGLTAEQKAKAEPIALEMRKQLTEVRTNNAVTPAEKRVKAKEIRDAAVAKLKDILTADQLEKWQRQFGGPRRVEGTNRPTAAPKN